MKWSLKPPATNLYVKAAWIWAHRSDVCKNPSALKTPRYSERNIHPALPPRKSTNNFFIPKDKSTIPNTPNKTPDHSGFSKNTVYLAFRVWWIYTNPIWFIITHRHRGIDSGLTQLLFHLRGRSNGRLLLILLVLLLMAEIRRFHQLRLVVSPIIYRVAAPSQVVMTGFQPSTVWILMIPKNPRMGGWETSFRFWEGLL